MLRSAFLIGRRFFATTTTRARVASFSTNNSSSAAIAELMSKFPPVPNVAQWSPRVWLALGQNPSPYTLNGSNIYLVGTGKSRILLDTGEGKEDFPAILEQAMAQSGTESIQEIVLTHHHMDHIGGINQIQSKFRNQAPPLRVSKNHRKNEGVYSENPLEAAESHNNKGEKAEGATEEEDPHETRFRREEEMKYCNIEDGQVFRTEGATLRAVYTPGHCEDHMCFILEEENSLFSGDTILGFGTTVFQDLHDYLASLRRLATLTPSRIYPAHGLPVENAVGKIEEIIAHRLKREEQVLAVLKASTGAMTPGQIVSKIYDSLPPALLRGAAQNVTLHLKKLTREGVVHKVQRDSIKVADIDAEWGIGSGSRM